MRHLRAFVTPVVLLAAACGGAASDEAASTELPLLTVAEPTLEIGVVEGDDAYMFAAVSGLIRLDDGTVAVADDGNTKISVYDAAGTHLKSWGSRGEGPGEFRTLSRIYRHGPDSLMAADNATSRVSVFDLQGGLGRQLDGVDISGDSLFQLDSWLYGRFWVDGALDAAARERVRRTLDGLPPPRASPGYRRVRVAADEALWIQESPGAPDGPSTWTRTDPAGRPDAAVDLPARFSPMDIIGDDLLGVWADENGVSFVRGYRLTSAGTTRPVPSWLLPLDSVASTSPAPTEDEFMDLMRQSIRQMAMAQEMHYSRSRTYTTAVDSLDFEDPAGLDFDFTHAHTRGWAAVFTHPSMDRLCALAYGFGMPPGWVPGQISCGPASPSVALPR